MHEVSGILVHFLRLLGLWRPGAQSARDIHLLALTLSNIYRLKITDRLSNKRFLIWLLTPHHILNMFLHYQVIYR